MKSPKNNRKEAAGREEVKCGENKDVIKEGSEDKDAEVSFDGFLLDDLSFRSATTFSPFGNR
jgi:hypothetical protein